MHFDHSLTTPRVLFGAGYLRRLGDEIDRLEVRRALLVGTDTRGLVESVADVLGARVAGRVNDIREHVPTEQAVAATELAGELRTDVLVAAGGGSTIGTAKAVARRTGTPIIAVPTTFAGSEMTSIWGETDGRVKTTGRNPAVLPRTVIYDPDLVMSLPVDLAALSGMNALAHCAETIYDRECSPLTKLAAVEGARVLVTNLDALASVGGSDDRAEVYNSLLYGSWLAGLALGNATMGLHHKLCHVLGGMRLSHGGLHSVLLPYVMAYQRNAAACDLARLEEAVDAADAASTIWSLGRRLGTPASLAELGFQRAQITEAVAAVMASPPVSPRAVDQQSLTELLNAACDGAPPHPREKRGDR